MKVAILGFDTEGRISYDYWNRDGNEITICDRNPELAVPDGVPARLGDKYLQGLDEFDLLVRTAGLKPRDIVNANSAAITPKITSGTDEFLRVCPTRNTIGITGTKGKGTASTLTAKILEAAGKRVHLGGNIGVPALALLKENIQPDDWVVLELSSFQLIDLKQSPHLAACLMVMPEHLDWHTDLPEYLAAKQQLFRWQKPEDVAVFYAGNENSRAIASVSHGRLIPYLQAPGAFVAEDGTITIDGQAVCNVSELKLLGKHNWQNVCAAVTLAWQITQDAAAIRSVLTAFTGLEHRLEKVRELDGVTYYDDSFGTTPETAQVALEAFAQPKIIILGGSDKGASYDALAQTVANGNVRKALLIGQQAARIQAALEAAGFHDFMPGGDSMPEIIQTARAQAQPGDVVLLSPGCASFGMFKNYKDRGNQFNRAVLALV